MLRLERSTIEVHILLGSGSPAESKQRKPEKTVSSKPKWEQYTPSGVYYKDVVDFVNDFDKAWRFIGQTKTDQICMTPINNDARTNGVLKTWIKRMHREADLKYALALYELKCKTDELRVKSTIEYDKDGGVLESTEYSNIWSDVVPDSMGEMIMHTVLPDASLALQTPATRLTNFLA